MRAPMTRSALRASLVLVVVSVVVVSSASAHAQEVAALTARFDELQAVVAQPGPHPPALRCELGSLMTQLRRGLPLDQLDRAILELGQPSAAAERAVLAHCLYFRGREEGASGWQRRAHGYDPDEVTRSYFERARTFADADSSLMSEIDAALARLPAAPDTRVVTVPGAIIVPDDVHPPEGYVVAARARVVRLPPDAPWEGLAFVHVGAPAGVWIAMSSAHGWVSRAYESSPCCEDSPLRFDLLRAEVRTGEARSPVFVVRVARMATRMGPDGYCITDSDGHCEADFSTRALFAWFAPSGELAGWDTVISTSSDERHENVRVELTERGIVRTPRRGRRTVVLWADVE